MQKKPPSHRKNKCRSSRPLRTGFGKIQKEGVDCASGITKDLMRFGRASMTEATFAFTA